MGWIYSYPSKGFVWTPLKVDIISRIYVGAKGKIVGLISFIEKIIPFTKVDPVLQFYEFIRILLNKLKFKIKNKK